VRHGAVVEAGQVEQGVERTGVGVACLQFGQALAQQVRPVNQREAG
jgi:hypothetical protein